ncbi:MAG: hypothetical protein Q8M20_17920 [Rhodocyclaceae bacterium]|nr:hypothetical protein [Rhodocyclaceae bacterium]
MTISERLKKLRLKLELSQPDAAIKFDIPLGSWKKYERGPSEPGSGALRGLHDGGVNINWLLTGEGEMFRNSKPRGLEVFSAPPTYSTVDADAHKDRGAVREDAKDVPVDSSYTQGEQTPSEANPIDIDVLEICVLFVGRQNEKNRVTMTPREMADAVGAAYQVIMRDKAKENTESFSYAQSILKNLVKSM